MTIIQGQVLDPDGRPVREASVYFVTAPVPMPDIAQLTDEQGKFVLSIPAPGRYSLGAYSETWGSAEITFEVSGEQPQTLEVQFTSLEG